MTKAELDKRAFELKGKTEDEYIDIIIKLEQKLKRAQAIINKEAKDKFDTTSEKIMPPKASYERKPKNEIKKSGRKVNDKNITSKIKERFIKGEIKDGDYIGKNRVRIIKISNDDTLNNYKKIDDEVTIKLEYHPGYYEYLIIVKEKGSYKTNDGDDSIITASLDDPLEKKILTSNAVSHIIEQKYAYGTPVNRLMQEFKAVGVDIDYNVILKSMMDVGASLIPLSNEILSSTFTKAKYNSYIDETTYKLTHPEIKDDGKKRQNHYIYALSNEYVSAYKYTGSRKADWLVDLIILLNYKNYITTDDYGGYKALDEYIEGRQLCLSHLRRKIYYAYISLPKKLKEKEDGEARKALHLIDKIFILERKIKDKSDDEKYKYRNSSEYLKVINEFKEFMISLNPASGTYLDIAKNYCLNNWESFWIYLKNGNLEATNTNAELNVKKIAMIRKNSLHFSNSDSASINCAILTIVQTALKNKVDLNRYLNYVIHYIGIVDVKDLLPWSNKLYTLSEDYIV